MIISCHLFPEVNQRKDDVNRISFFGELVFSIVRVMKNSVCQIIHESCDDMQF
jgi:hypothetical protein